MKQVLLLALLLVVKNEGEEILSSITLYNLDSYYKQKVYAEHTQKSFYQLADANTKLDPLNYDIHLLNAAFFYSTNKLRNSKGLKELTYSSVLRDAAVVHTNEMITKNFFDHYNRKNRKLYSPADRFKLFNLQANYTAENVDLNYVKPGNTKTYIEVAEMIVDALYHSREHKINMMGKNYDHLGCAVMFANKLKDGVWYFKATQDFSGN